MATQYQQKLNRLKAYVRNSKYIETKEQPIICKRFGLHYVKSVFQNEYRKRFYNYLKLHTTTAATVSKATQIPHKYLCECKAYFEKRKLLKVVFMGRCPTTGSNNVQFISTNPQTWGNTNPMEQNQLDLFENNKHLTALVY